MAADGATFENTEGAEPFPRRPGVKRRYARKVVGGAARRIIEEAREQYIEPVKEMAAESVAAATEQFSAARKDAEARLAELREKLKPESINKAVVETQAEMKERLEALRATLAWRTSHPALSKEDPLYGVVDFAHASVQRKLEELDQHFGADTFLAQLRKTLDNLEGFANGENLSSTGSLRKIMLDVKVGTALGKRHPSETILLLDRLRGEYRKDIEPQIMHYLETTALNYIYGNHEEFTDGYGVTHPIHNPPQPEKLVGLMQFLEEYEKERLGRKTSRIFSESRLQELAAFVGEELGSYTRALIEDTHGRARVMKYGSRRPSAGFQVRDTRDRKGPLRSARDLARVAASGAKAAVSLSQKLISLEHPVYAPESREEQEAERVKDLFNTLRMSELLDQRTRDEFLRKLNDPAHAGESYDGSRIREQILKSFHADATLGRAQVDTLRSYFSQMNLHFDHAESPEAERIMETTVFENMGALSLRELAEYANDLHDAGLLEAMDKRYDIAALVDRKLTIFRKNGDASGLVRAWASFSKGTRELLHLEQEKPQERGPKRATVEEFLNGIEANFPPSSIERDPEALLRRDTFLSGHMREVRRLYADQFAIDGMNGVLTFTGELIHRKVLAPQNALSFLTEKGFPGMRLAVSARVAGLAELDVTACVREMSLMRKNGMQELLTRPERKNIADLVKLKLQLAAQDGPANALYLLTALESSGLADLISQDMLQHWRESLVHDDPTGLLENFRASDLPD